MQNRWEFFWILSFEYFPFPTSQEGQESVVDHSKHQESRLSLGFASNKINKILMKLDPGFLAQHDCISGINVVQQLIKK